MNYTNSFHLFIGSTYDGALDFSDYNFDLYVGETVQQEIHEKCEKLGLDYDEVVADLMDRVCIYQEFSAKIADHGRQAVEDEGLDKILEKYDIKITNVDFWQPREYNFQNDMMQLDFEYSDKLLDLVQSTLSSKINQYIVELRQASYDGYMSLEPSDIMEVVEQLQNNRGACFGAILWAIFDLENRHCIIDDMSYLIQDWCFEDWRALYDEAIHEEIYKWLEA